MQPSGIGNQILSFPKTTPFFFAVSKIFESEYKFSVYFALCYLMLFYTFNLDSNYEEENEGEHPPLLFWGQCFTD